MLGNPSYPTYQVFIAAALSAFLTGALMPVFIRLMRHEGVGQQIRADGPQRHLQKQGTPTMGGVIILLGVVVTCLIQSRLTPEIVLALVVMLATGALGLMDDIESVAHKRSLGLTPPQKMAGLVTVSVAFCLCAVNACGTSPTIEFPGGLTIDLGIFTTVVSLGGAVVRVPWLYVAFVFLLMAGLSNAVNLTDGLDGLAGGCVLVTMLAMAMVAFSFGSSDLAVFAASIAGACTGFLWHNCYPASIFMGDTGSLALGGSFAALAVLTKTEVTSLVMGGLFICEALSVIVQVVSFKSTGRRVFLMAPVHHHFEKLGWSETKVVIRFWIVSAAFAALGFALYFQLS
ncbi:phospho-N-acetylmuramoyl-pentapeptide-transferase [Olsenella massiliensis]|uniref:phospho-N-acetylmuramoyl-pentapeptide- transferase n=1 Tax=Olsenella massiliensis TaxID=1622075 RepID=UPI00071D6655|nr:phospho-N-acetylmuramoyl-pentapeptide-transferase [Olsenella massiliensis]